MLTNRSHILRMSQPAAFPTWCWKIYILLVHFIAVFVNLFWKKTHLCYNWYLRKTNWDIRAYEWFAKKCIFPKNRRVHNFYYSVGPFPFFVRNIRRDYLISLIGMCCLVLIHSEFCVWLKVMKWKIVLHLCLLCSNVHISF